jgi:hypothetical protein
MMCTLHDCGIMLILLFVTDQVIPRTSASNIHGEEVRKVRAQSQWSKICTSIYYKFGTQDKHVERMDPDRLPKQILSYAPRGRRSLGRPKKHWKETITDPLGSNTWWWWWWQTHTLQSVALPWNLFLILEKCKKNSLTIFAFCWISDVPLLKISHVCWVGSQSTINSASFCILFIQAVKRHVDWGHAVHKELCNMQQAITVSSVMSSCIL